jgi:thioredoxin 1
MNAAASDEQPLLVACLCAAWCGTCNDYRAVFESLAAEQEAAADRWVWVDIEDDEAVLGAIDVDDFPTLLIARGNAPCFFGPVMPHAQTARQLVQRARRGELGTAGDTRLPALARAITALRSD